MAEGQPKIHVHKIISMPFDENTYVVHQDDSNACVVVDPGLEPAKIVHAIEQHQLTPEAILCTHGHADHIAGNAYLKQRWPQVPLIIGEGDAEKLTDSVANLSAGFGIRLVSPPADQTVAEGDTLNLAGIQMVVRETPGHSIGHVVFIVEAADPPLVLGGDVLFAGSIGRTDFPDGSFAVLKQSIEDKLYTLPDATVVWPGHGPETTVGREKKTNPFVGENAQLGA